MSFKYTAKVIIPTKITDTMLISCTVPEPGPGEIAWVSGTTYAVNDIRILTSTHKKYKRAIAGAGTVAPNLDTTNWVDIGATNRWAQFDEKIGTVTSAATSTTTVLDAGSIEGLALLELTGSSATVSMVEAPGGAVVYSKTVSLDGTVIESVYDWMYAPFVQRKNWVLSDLPGQYPSGRITVTVTGTTAAVGVLSVGRVTEIGATEYGAGAGLINWGKVTDDGFGNREWEEGAYSSRITLPIVIDTSSFSTVYRALVALRSTPAIYIGTEISKYDPLVCYGVFKDLYMTVPNNAVCTYNLEIEGLSNI